VVEAVQEQAARFLHTDFTIVPYEVYVGVAERLVAAAPFREPAKAAFFNAGTEAVENAVKFARAYTRRPAVIGFEGAFHGRTLLSLTLTSKTHPYKAGLGPFAPEVYRVPFPYEYREVSAADALAAIERAFTTQVARDQVAAIILEPAGGRSMTVPTNPKFLKELRDETRRRGVVLIFDEVVTGFRMAAGGAQEYFGVKADLVTYGKTVGGGFPVGVVCGRRELMKRFRDDRPADICLARGTFNSHPAVMGAMDEFLRHIEKPEVIALYRDLDGLWNGRAAALNARFAADGLPVRVANLSSIWTVCYSCPSRYNWMLQYYLRAEGLALSWIGTGRLIFTLNYTDADFAAVADRFIAAATAMRNDGWWWCDPAATDKTVKRRILKEMIARRLSALRGHR
jgi:glutamate-1-semialdehyde 2,1-aminomutase